MSIELVENPRRKRRKSTRRRRKTTRRRRRNPIMSLTNPRRRKRRTTYSKRRRSYRRNPGLGGMFGSFDFNAALFVGVGMIGTEIVPGLARRFLPAISTAGPMGYLVKVGAALATGFAVKMITRSSQRQMQAVSGGLALIVVDLYRQFVAPMIGLSGYNDQPVYYGDVSDAMDGYVGGVNEYVDAPAMGEYVSNPVGAY